MAVKLMYKIKICHDETVKKTSSLPSSNKKNMIIDYECWASVKDVSAIEFNKGEGQDNFEQLKSSFRVRYCNFTKNLNVNTKKYYIVFNGLKYDIKFACDYKQQHKWIDIKAVMVK